MTPKGGNTQSSRTVPITAVAICPMIPPQWMPIHPSTFPPINPPTIPTSRLIQNPNPAPFMILPARNPASAPMRIVTIICCAYYCKHSFQIYKKEKISFSIGTFCICKNKKSGGDARYASWGVARCASLIAPPLALKIHLHCHLPIYLSALPLPNPRTQKQRGQSHRDRPSIFHQFTINIIEVLQPYPPDFLFLNFLFFI